jgi:NAD-dependent dihydropyrimidine dehydrogenase PreA subunit
MSLDMAVEVDKKLCDGCGICVKICPLDCLRMDEDKKAFMKYDECWYCGSCTLDCPLDAIVLRLPYLVR